MTRHKPDASPATRTSARLPNRRCRRSAGTGHREKPATQDAHAIGHALGFVQVVRRQHHRVTPRAQVEHEVAHQARALRIETGRGLVEQHDWRLVQQRAGQGHPLLQALRQLGAQAVAAILQAEPFQRLRHRAGRVAPTDAAARRPSGSAEPSADPTAPAPR